MKRKSEYKLGDMVRLTHVYFGFDRYARGIFKIIKNKSSGSFIHIELQNSNVATIIVVYADEVEMFAQNPINKLYEIKK